MSSLPEHRYTPEEYLTLEREAEYKSEYINGLIYAMSGGSKEHVTIATNIAGELYGQMKGSPCRVYNSDMRVRINPTGMYTYPDVTALCGEPLYEDNQFDTLTNPTIIIEVVSPSTEAYDRGVKFAHYRKLESLKDYVLVSQDRMMVEHFVRSGEKGDQWLLTESSEPNSLLYLTSIDCTVALRDIYDKVEFPSSEGEEV